MDLQGPDISDSRDPTFSDSRDPMIIFSDSRDLMFNCRDPNRVLRKPGLSRNEDDSRTWVKQKCVMHLTRAH